MSKWFRFLIYVGSFLIAKTAFAQGYGLISAQAVTQGNNQQTTYLIVSSNLWHYRLGTNAPQQNWKTATDSELDSTWLTGPGGFGYGDNDDATFINMSNRFTTLYIRKTFTIDETISPEARLELVIDYDDGFIAWIDGVEVARSTNAPGTQGVEPSYNSVSRQPNHEALLYRGLPAEVYNLGTVGSRLQPGEHVLALMGFNGTLTSEDFSLIPALRVTLNQNSAINGTLFSIVYTNSIILQGSNSVPNAVSVTVNGLPASFNPSNNLWQLQQTIAPGVNRFYIAAHNAEGNIVASTNRYVVYTENISYQGGRITNDTLWANNATIELTNDVTISSGSTLRIQNDAVVLLRQGISIRTESNAAIYVSGSDLNPVYFIPADGSSYWGSLTANGSNSILDVSFAEIVAGQLIANNGAVMRISDSRIRDFRNTGRLFITSTNAASVLLQRCHISNYDQIRFSQSPITIDGCLFEEIWSDATDFSDSANITVRMTTYRYGHGSNTDALDFGNNPGAIVDSCLVYGIPDKAVSIADFTHSALVSNCLFYSNGIGISAYGSSNCVFNQNTIVGNNYGLWLRQRYTASGPAYAAGTNNIIWNNTTNIIVTDGSTLQLSFSDVQGTAVYPGTENINLDPLFLNPSAADYRIADNSPAHGAGFNGLNMGIISEVGGIPAEPLNLFASALSSTRIKIVWMDNSDNENRFIIQRSTDSVSWQDLASLPSNSSYYYDDNIVPETRYYYRARASNAAGNSPFSNISSAMTQLPRVIVGGLISSNTVWHPQNGIYVVSSNITVSNATLTISAGTTVFIPPNTAIRATNYGSIIVSGTPDNRVHFFPTNGLNIWRELSANGTNANLTVRFADFSQMQVTVYNGASGLIEDSYFHDYNPSSSDIFTHPILLTYYAGSFIMRRCHINNYYEVLLRDSLHTVEDCLFENPTGDALDFDAAQPGTIIRRCTFRNGPVTNVDAIDIGNDGNRYSTFVTIEDCIMYNFPYDKGVSIGDGSHDIIVRNCLIYGCHSGVAVKDECTASIYNCTLVDNDYGINLQAKYPTQYQGGRATNTYNNIIWFNKLDQILVTNNPIIVVNFSNIQGTNWPGTGNISADPMFRDPANRDYRLLPASPCIGSGSNSLNMGVIFPIGGLPAPPANLTLVSNAINSVILSWQSPTQFHSGFIIERAQNSGDYITIATVSSQTTNYTDTSLFPSSTYNYRVRATNFIGSSFESDSVTFMTSPAPVILLQPDDLSVNIGQDATFIISAIGYGTLRYQWFFNSTPLADQTNAILVLRAVSPELAGNYYAVVFDDTANSITSRVAQLQVNSPTVNIELSSLTYASNGFGFRFIGQPQREYVVEATVNFTHWTAVYTNSSPTGIIEFQDPQAQSYSKRFYRIRF